MRSLAELFEAVDENGRWVPRVIHPDDDAPPQLPAKMTPAKAFNLFRGVAFKYRNELVNQADLDDRSMRIYLVDLLRSDGSEEAKQVAGYLDRGRGPLPKPIKEWLSMLPGWPRHKAVDSGTSFGQYKARREYETSPQAFHELPPHAAIPEYPDESELIDQIVNALNAHGSDSNEVAALLDQAPRAERKHLLSTAMRQAKYHPKNKDIDPARVLEYVPEDERIKNIKWMDQKSLSRAPYCLRVLQMATKLSNRNDPVEFAKELAAGNDSHIHSLIEALRAINKETAYLSAVLDAAEFVDLLQKGRISLQSRNGLPGKIDDKGTQVSADKRHYGTGIADFSL